MNKLIKIGLAILFLLCLTEMPYGFFQLVRFLALIGFGVLALEANRNGKQEEVIIYVALAILFQPLLKISLGRTLWNVVDFIVAAGLIFSVFSSSSNKNK